MANLTSKAHNRPKRQLTVTLKSIWKKWFSNGPEERKAMSVCKRLRWGVVSITGNFRGNNEDRCLAHPDGRYMIVADGMGGQSAGEKASELAIELVPQRLDQLLNFDVDTPEKVSAGIDTAVGHANDEIMALGELD